MPSRSPHYNWAEERRATNCSDLRVPEGESIIVVPSNAGKKYYPSWYLNLRANPQAEVQLGREIWQVRAREATSEERERLWPFLASQYGGYQVYRERTDRHIPVIILEAV